MGYVRAFRLPPIRRKSRAVEKLACFQGESGQATDSVLPFARGCAALCNIFNAFRLPDHSAPPGCPFLKRSALGLLAIDCVQGTDTFVPTRVTISGAIKAWREDSRDRNPIVSAALMGVFLVPVLILALGREYFNYATETDLLNTYAPEARRILAGEALTIAFHPPGYSLVLAGVLGVVRDLFSAGLVVSVLSSTLALVVNFKAYQMLLGRWSGWASVTALWASTPLLILSVSATSDAFFFLLFSLVLWLTVAVIQKPHNLRLSLALGLCVGIAFLTRSNGITLFAAAAAPFVSVANLRAGSLGPRVKSFAAVLIGALVPIVMWFLVSKAYGMPFSPGGTIDNLAMTYFSSGDGIGFESMRDVKGRFDSLSDVLLHDPAAMASQYVRDLILIPDKVSKSIAYPVSLLAIVGIYALCKRGRRAFLAVMILIFLPQILLVNLKTFEHRFYVFLAPLIAVSIWEAIIWGYRLVEQASLKKVCTVFVLAASLFVGLTTLSNAHNYIHAQDEEIGSLIAKTGAMDVSSSIVVSRKPQTAYYLGAQHHLLIGGHDMRALKEMLQTLHTESGHDVFVYYGSMERWKWDALDALAADGDPPDWLTRVACYDPLPSSWCLYQYSPPVGSDLG